MKQMMKMVLAVAMAATGGLSALSAVRVETRTMPLIATGVESVGSADDSGVSEWDTTQEPDGWTTLTSGGTTADVLVLNGPSVVGGRLSQNEAWDDARVVVVRDDIVVPSDMTLTLGAGCIVKFTDGARIVVEDGGAVVAEGAYLAAFADDSVGGDTDMNGRRDEVIAPYQLSIVKQVRPVLQLPLWRPVQQPPGELREAGDFDGLRRTDVYRRGEGWIDRQAQRLRYRKALRERLRL